MTDTERALRRAILLDPADDLLRGAFADYLDEQGDGDRAEFVRVQLELAKIDPHIIKTADYIIRQGCDASPRHTEWVSAVSLRRRERELLRPVLYALCETLPGGGWDYFRRDGATDWADLYHNGRPVFENAIFRRGFVESITCTTDNFLSRAATIFAEQPVEKVTLSDRDPNGGVQGSGVLHDHFGWRTSSWREYPSSLPTELFDWLTECKFDGRYWNYPSHEAAIEALSAACVLYGRRQANLIP